VLFARLICSDPICAEILEEIVKSDTEAIALACACGCTVEVLELSAWEPAEPRLRVLSLAA
jgi:hypothetical protein